MNAHSPAPKRPSARGVRVRDTISASYVKRLARFGLELPSIAGPEGSYLGYSKLGRSLYVSGQHPVSQGKPSYVGRVGREVSVEDAKAAAGLCALNVLAQLADGCAYNFDAVRRCVRVGVFVNAERGFSEHPFVADGASELILEVLGDRGRHARAAIGVASLSFDVPVEVDALFEVDLAPLRAARSEVLL